MKEYVKAEENYGGDKTDAALGFERVCPTPLLQYYQNDTKLPLHDSVRNSDLAARKLTRQERNG